MIQSNNFLPTGPQVPLSPTGEMVVEVLQKEEISGGGKNGGKKPVGSAIRWRTVNRGA